MLTLTLKSKINKNVPKNQDMEMPLYEFLFLFNYKNMYLQYL